LVLLLVQTGSILKLVQPGFKIGIPVSRTRFSLGQDWNQDMGSIEIGIGPSQDWKKLVLAWGQDWNNLVQAGQDWNKLVLVKTGMAGSRLE
jgi:hypothetical protein